MREDVLKALAAAAKVPDENGWLRLYHATSEQAAQAILVERALRPATPTDPAQALLARGGGSVFLSSSPAIGGELGQRVVLAVDVDASGTPGEVIRAGWGDPPRVELQSDLRPVK